MPSHATPKCASKQAATPCANNPKGCSLINTWRSGQASLSSKDWNYVKYTGYEPESRACYAWLYLPTATEKEIDTYGMDILMSFVEAGEETEARRFMSEHLSRSHMFKHIKSDDELQAIKMAGTRGSTTYLEILAENARATIVDGNFEYGNELLATLITLLTTRLIQASRFNQALSETNTKGGGKPSESGIGSAADQLGKIASGIGAIIKIYPIMIQQYRAEGNLASVNQARQGWGDLKRRIGEFKEAFASEPAFIKLAGFGDPGVSLIEAVYVNNQVYHHNRHKKWTLIGMDAESSVAPVTPFNDKYDEYNSITYETSVGEGLDTLIEQQELRLQLYDLPTVREAFPSGLPDMQDRNSRIKVWAAAFAYYEAEAGGNSERMTMYLIERYLKTYTRHSQFNISDFGDSFIKREYPTSLFGRAMQDCGVYAMSVASEMHAALEMNGAKGYEFMIFFVPAHVTMIMLKDDKFFIVNNDEITGPHDLYGKGDLEQLSNPLDDDGVFMISDKQKEEREAKINNRAIYGMVAKTNADMNNQEFWGSPMTGVSLGETGSPTASDFDVNAWQKYEAAATYSRDHEVSSGGVRELIKDIDGQLKALKGHLIAAGDDAAKQQDFLLRNSAVLEALFNSIWLVTLGSHYNYMTQEYYTTPGQQMLTDLEENMVPHLSEFMGAVGKAGMHTAADSPLRVLVRLINTHAADLLKLSALPPELSGINLKQAQVHLRVIVNLASQLDDSFDIG